MLEFDYKSTYILLRNSLVPSLVAEISVGVGLLKQRIHVSIRQ